MGFLNSGGLTAIMALLTCGALVGCLLPQVDWAKHGDTHISLWKNCSTVTFPPTNITPEFTVTECTKLEKLRLQDFKSVPKAERDGTVAGCVLGGFLAVLSLVPLCCRSKCLAIFFAVFQLIFVCAALGCWYRYQTKSLDDALADSKYSFGLGFWLCAVAVGTSLFTVVGGCFIRKSEREGYGYLA